MDRIPKHADGHSFSLRSLGYAHTRAAQSRRPGRFAARSLSWSTPCRVPREAFVIKESGPQARSARLRATPNGA